MINVSIFKIFDKNIIDNVVFAICAIRYFTVLGTTSKTPTTVSVFAPATVDARRLGNIGYTGHYTIFHTKPPKTLYNILRYITATMVE